jgi:hypothetical protein
MTELISFFFKHLAKYLTYLTGRIPAPSPIPGLGTFKQISMDGSFEPRTVREGLSTQPRAGRSHPISSLLLMIATYQ